MTGRLATASTDRCLSYRYENLDIEVRGDDAEVHVRLSGAAGIGECDALEMVFTRITAARPRHAIVDGRQLRAISVLALGVLGTFHRSLRSRGGGAEVLVEEPEALAACNAAGLRARLADPGDA